jgi:hypothetical protein
MVKKDRPQLTLDQPVRYRIKVPGELDQNWRDWAGDMAVNVESTEDGMTVTTLTGPLDQAALQGLLRRLYSFGLPLISVNCMDCGESGPRSLVSK